VLSVLAVEAVASEVAWLDVTAAVARLSVAVPATGGEKRGAGSAMRKSEVFTRCRGRHRCEQAHQALPTPTPCSCRLCSPLHDPLHVAAGWGPVLE